jgi:hypothetical protein
MTLHVILRDTLLWPRLLPEAAQAKSSFPSALELKTWI